MLYQYVAAALVSENKSLAHPASVDSIPTSANQEDHVSMGPIAARGAAAVIANVEQVLALEALAAAQGVDFRLRTGPTTRPRRWSRSRPLGPSCRAGHARPMSLRLLAAVPVVAALSVACSSSNLFDSNRLQQVLGQWLEDNAQVTANVTCPNNEPLKQGDTFTCTAVTQDGLTLTIKVIQTDNQGGFYPELEGAS